MSMYLEIGELRIPSYGFFIVLGIAIANVIAICKIKKSSYNIYDFILLETYVFLGAFIGSKGLYLWTSRDYIEWNKIWELEYFNRLMQGGFVFYGGLIGALIFLLIGGKIHKINAIEYIRKFIYLIPLVHGFGRIGCFMAGCCYGCPYKGVGSVIFPKETLAVSGIPLFPIQLVEAFFLFLIFLLLFFFVQYKVEAFMMELYFFMYAVLRFILENFRGDTIRGEVLYFSTSQWISLFFIFISMVSFAKVILKKRN